MFTLLGSEVTVVVCILVIAALIKFSGAIKYIPNDRVGVIEKLWSSSGSVQNGLLALNGEAGLQPELRRGGFHFFAPFQYRVHIHPMVSVTQGTIAYVFARDGLDLPAGQTLADNSRIVDFRNVRDFLRDGGQKGPQRMVLREGTHIINPALFVVMTEETTYSMSLDALEKAYYQQMRGVLDERGGFKPVVIKEVTGSHDSDQLAVVTVQDGPGLLKDELLAPDVGDSHNAFQEPEKFLAAGGRRGRQERVLVEGTYFINRLFATVEFIKKTIIPVGFVGVVVSYTGRVGTDLSGTEYSHGELVETGCRGVWRDALMPGKYAFNTYAGKIELVPTTNFVLMWKSGESGSNFDKNLREITLITKDAFEPQLPLSVVVHIDYRKAPMVVQRFGNVAQLVEQTLDPMVSSYFKNVSQTKTFIDLIQSRSELQNNASTDMKQRFQAYSLEFQEVLIGTPKPQPGDNKIEDIMAQLRDRQIAREQVETFAQKQIAADKQRELNEAEQRAAKQKELTGSLVDISIKENQGSANVKAAEKRRQEIEALAQADKFRQEMEGAGRASAIRSVGEAEAAAIQAKSEAMQGEGADKQLMQTVMLRLAEAFETAKVPLVPQVQMGGGDSNAFGTLMGLMSVMKAGELTQSINDKG
ncbi:flotillin family protein [Duganella sp. BJB488]|uniref:SPFH domain-containing protein n=1 Tax=unclassified Duganella TaxID=2636909 RepID=UPI000E342E39|nr:MULTISPECIES: SPFH domain-containing protein [unclassified Duganella]RFP09087.1 flotillin family protein [Duganella sp. BJB489]RFP12518.1 flotillin family protein [Duganella sp. BJB488]RFP29087.1 flotillin family protein [Duganella sp. BJB480]